MQTILARRGITDVPPILLEQAEGSVGLALQAYEILQHTPPELLPTQHNLPRQPLDSLEMAKAIASLELDTQLWLADYWQKWLWQNWQKNHPVSCLEQAKQYLKNFVQPRLVWEVTLWELVKALV
jgi:DNA polymerase-3 subunit delta'